MSGLLLRGLRASCVALALGTAALPAAAQGLAGAYLAATQADIRNDYQSAADYYQRALIASPTDAGLLRSAMIANVGADRMMAAVEIANRLQVVAPTDQIMALVRIADGLREQDYADVLAIAEDGGYRFNPLFAQLIAAWSLVGQGDYAAATERFDAMSGNAAFNLYGSVHKALALALAGDFGAAAGILDGGTDGPLHVSRLALLAHISSLSQADRMADAIAAARDSLANGLADPELEGILAQLEAGQPLVFDQITSARDGAAAVFALLAQALSREDADRLGLIYGRLAAHIRPDYAENTVLVADILSGQGQFDLAVSTYAEIKPESPWYVSAELGRADALRDADRVDEAIEVLSKLSRERPEDIAILTALGDVLRNNEDFTRAADAYTKAIALLGTETQSHWLIYYSRGISYERTDRWPLAEADFRKALELNPDQPLVLNYLGYSLVELRQNLDEAQAMIEKAVEQRPDDGYITDSLGWVLYRIGKYEEAVPHMERAAELLPVDPIINDHLGDVLWMVGRKLEARFQWRRALSFEPEEEEAVRIRRKLEVGLDKVLAEEAALNGAAQPATVSGN